MPGIAAVGKAACVIAAPGAGAAASVGATPENRASK